MYKDVNILRNILYIETIPQIVRITEEVANRYRKEYSEEVESYEFLAQNQLLLYDTDNSSSIRKLSKFSHSIRNY